MCNLLKTGILTVLGALLLAACAGMPKPKPPPPPPPLPPNQAGAPAPGTQTGHQQGANQTRSAGRQSAAQAGSQGKPGARAARNGQSGGAPGGAGNNAGGPPPGAATGGERQQTLNGEFAHSLGKFDQRLAREGQKLDTEDEQARKDAASKQAASGGGANGSGGRSSGLERRSIPAAPAGVGSGGGNAPKEVAGDDNGGDQADVPHPPPADIPSGADDDVVAKQLREAAEHEDDPKLRAKLWDEYRKYKKNQ